MRVEGYVTEEGALRISEPDALDRALKKLAGAPVVVEVKRRQKARSQPQNRYYHGVIVKMVAEETGYTSEETHAILCAEHLREPGDFGMPDRIRSTTELTTAEAEEFFSKCRAWASAELGLYIPEPHEDRAL